jgi:hypothetical protein
MGLFFTIANSSRVNLGGNVPLFNNAAGGTIMAWFRTLSAGGAFDQRIFSVSIGPGGAPSINSRMTMGINTVGNPFMLGRNSDAVSNNRFDAGSSVTAGVWNHMAFSFDCPSRTGLLYLNGVQLTSGFFTNSTGANYSATNAGSANIGAGADGTDGFFGGDLEDVRSYGRVLSVGEIMTIFSAMGKDGIVADLQGRWPMKELGEGISLVQTADIAGQSIIGLPSATAPVYSSSSVTSERSRRPWERGRGRRSR